jgi:hypothetical protein
MTGSLQGMVGSNWDYFDIIWYRHYLHGGIMLFKSGLGLATNIYCQF